MLPLDWRTPFGFIVAWLSQVFGGFAVFSAITPFYSLIFASEWLFIVIADSITKELNAFNHRKITNKNHKEMMHRFCDIIQLYSHAKQ